MRIPESLVTLADYGIIEEVVRPLMSGKEAEVYLVISGGEQRVAKVYKDADHRSFKNRAAYTEGRGVRNTRDQRAISKRSTHGRAQDEAAWRSTEVEMIYRLQAAGVRVPVPYNFIDGVLVMELITDGEGNPAPRLGELHLTSEEATAVYERLVREVVRMLCAGVVHGDLSDFNVLMAADGPVVIDFPQAVDAAHNQNARKLLLRDVGNLHDFLGRFTRHARRLPYAEEMWDLYESNLLTPETALTGHYRPSNKKADTASVLELIEGARYDERKRRERLGLKGGPSSQPAPGLKGAPSSQPAHRIPAVARPVAQVQQAPNSRRAEAPVDAQPGPSRNRRRQRSRRGGSAVPVTTKPSHAPAAPPPGPTNKASNKAKHLRCWICALIGIERIPNNGFATPLGHAVDLENLAGVNQRIEVPVKIPFTQMRIIHQFVTHHLSAMLF